jgi:hypothetical protein
MKHKFKIGDTVLIYKIVDHIFDSQYLGKVGTLTSLYNDESKLWLIKGVNVAMFEHQLIKGPFSKLEKIIYGIKSKNKRNKGVTK